MEEHVTYEGSLEINKEVNNQSGGLQMDYRNDCTVARESTVTDMGIAAIDAAEQAGYASTATAERIGLAADATAQRIGLAAESTAQRMAIAELDAVGKVGSDVCDSSRDIMRDLHAADNHVSDVVGRTSDKTQAEVERFGLSELEAIRNSERYLYAGMSANAREILLKSCADTMAIKDQSANQFKDLLLQNAENAKDAAVTACTNVKDLIILGDKHYSQIQIEALKNKEELARQIAECCCEQKALALETSHATQDLIRKLDEQRVRDELAKTREELIALRLRASLPPTPVAAVAI